MYNYKLRIKLNSNNAAIKYNFQFLIQGHLFSLTTNGNLW